MTILGSQLVLFNDLIKSPNLTDAKVRADIVDLRNQTVGKNVDYFVSQQGTIAGVAERPADQADQPRPDARRAVEPAGEPELRRRQAVSLGLLRQAVRWT